MRVQVTTDAEDLLPLHRDVKPSFCSHPLQQRLHGTTVKASELLQEGLADSIVPRNAMHSLAWTFGPIPPA